MGYPIFIPSHPYMPVGSRSFEGPKHQVTMSAIPRPPYNSAVPPVVTFSHPSSSGSSPVQSGSSRCKVYIPRTVKSLPFVFCSSPEVVRMPVDNVLKLEGKGPLVAYPQSFTLG